MRLSVFKLSVFLALTQISITEGFGQSYELRDSLHYEVFRYNKRDFRDSLRPARQSRDGTTQLPFRLQFLPVYILYLDTLKLNNPSDTNSLSTLDSIVGVICVRNYLAPNHMFEMPVFRGKRDYAIVHFSKGGRWSPMLRPKHPFFNGKFQGSPTFKMLRGLEADFVFILSRYNRYGYKKGNEFYIIEEEDRHLLLRDFIASRTG